MTIVEKVAYLRGLADGLNLNAEKSETKMFKAIMDVLDDMALTMSDLEDNVAVISEQVDAVDEDLDSLETLIYEDDIDLDDECDCCCDYYEVECPVCKEIINVDEGILEEGSIECPNCGEHLEFEVDYNNNEVEDEEVEVSK